VDNLFFNHIGLDTHISHRNFSDAASLLLKEQLKTWDTLKHSYISLDQVEVKTFQFEGFIIKVQYNPNRITSSSAKVDEKSIRERKCFLCPANLYPEQKAIKYEDDFLILVNPFPILPEHFTISHKDHIPQAIKNWFGTMLQLSKDLSSYVTIYNGPACGASAPDHHHFQAGSKYFMPLVDEFHLIKNEYGEILLNSGSGTVCGIDDGLRRFISIESTSSNFAEKVFDSFYSSYSKVTNAQDEPMMNIISYYEDVYGWIILIFLREKHRPTFFYNEGDDKILWSPAAIDLGGVAILPREKDFKKISKKILTDGLTQITFSQEKFNYIKSSLKEI
jgi:hypothetical protein